ncbi:Pyoverdine/dityrosine biosynthesis protein-domain-containing protein [Phlyctochytrium arcticum]|nr:Pyoverdine/dityrosine biosynthesis protein-domain-containing protein [Phlyctochytrium arcticum]
MLYPKDTHVFTYVRLSSQIVYIVAVGEASASNHLFLQPLTSYSTHDIFCEAHPALDLDASKLFDVGLGLVAPGLRYVKTCIKKTATIRTVDQNVESSECIPVIYAERIDESGHTQGCAILAVDERDESSDSSKSSVMHELSLGQRGATYLMQLVATRFISGECISSSVIENIEGENVLSTPLVDQLVDLFDTELRYVPHHDRWEDGKRLFTRQVQFFVSRNLPLQFALPAFPCKSSNTTDKVLGTYPDKGEELALRTMSYFVDKVKAIYPPGAIMSIISDGHVFSDLIGVDDENVNKYGGTLRETALDIFPPGRVKFYGLDDLLDVDHRQAFDHIPRTVLSTAFPTLQSACSPKLIATSLIASAEDARQVLEGLFGTDPKGVKRNVVEDSASSALYRGFSKFLLTDLAENATMTQLPSKNKRKTLCSKIAFEMIKRNNAYSAMVQMLLPLHIRLSIHPHDCSGPKFGIALIHKNYLPSRPTTANSETQFHIPTPWHNIVLEDAQGKISLRKHVEIREMMNEGKNIQLVNDTKGRPSHYREVANHIEIPIFKLLDVKTSTQADKNDTHTPMLSALSDPFNVPPSFYRRRLYLLTGLLTVALIITISTYLAVK